MSLEDLRAALAVLRGEPARSSAFSPSAAEGFALMGDSDVSLTAERFDIHYAFHPTPTEVDASAAAPMFANILKRASLERLTSPTLIELPQAGLSGGPARIWILPSPERITMVVRRSEQPIAQVTVRTNALPQFSGLPTVDESFVDYPAARPCPNCAREATRYKALRSARALICRGCGCSFPEKTSATD